MPEEPILAMEVGEKKDKSFRRLEVVGRLRCNSSKDGSKRKAKFCLSLAYVGSIIS